MAPKPKLTQSQIDDIRARKAADPDIRAAQFAEEFGVNESTISRVWMPEKLVSSPASGSDNTVLLAYQQLAPSPLNPRKTFDLPPLEEFAENIKSRGLLHNLIVRDVPGIPDQYWIIAGERRWSAIGLLVAQGRWDADQANIRCLVIDADDAQHRITAIIENLQRVDVPVLEEAQAFVDLQASDPKTWTAPAIAKLINKTARYVYQRMALATKLSDTVKEYLAANRISIEAARMLSGQEEEVQLSILDELENYTFISAADVRVQLRHSFIPLSRAFFPVDNLGPEIAVHEDEDDGTVLFESRSQFWELQTAAMNAHAEQLRAEWAWVKVSTPATRKSGHTYYITDYACPKDKSGAIVFADANGKVQILEHQVEDTRDQQDYVRVIPAKTGPFKTGPDNPIEADQGGDDLDEGDGNLVDDAGEDEKPDQDVRQHDRLPLLETTSPPKESAPVTKSHIYHAHRRKTVALRDAMANDWETAMRLTVFSLLCRQNGPLLISGGYAGLDDQVALTSEHTKMIAARLGKAKVPASNEFGSKKVQAFLSHILTMPAVDLRHLFAAVTAQFIHTPAGHAAELGDSPIVVAIAEHLKIRGDEEDQGLTVEREDLNGVRKATLLSMADQAGTPAINDSLPPGKIADAIAAKSKKYVLPTLRFATTAEIEKALKFK